MSYQTKLAIQEINKMNLLLGDLIQACGELVSKPSAKIFCNAADAEIFKIQHDRTIKAFVEKVGVPGMEALQSELALRAVSKAKGYQSNLRQLINESRLQKARITSAQYSGMGFSFSDFFSSSSTSNRDLGIDLLRSYYDYARLNAGFNYSSFDDFISKAEAKVPDFATNIGELVNMNSASTTQGEARNRLIDLANKSQGTASLSQIVTAAGGTGDTVNWTQAIPEIAVETGTNLVTTTSDILQSVGEGSIATLKLFKYLPWIIGGAALLYVAFMAKSHSDLIKKVSKRD